MSYKTPYPQHPPCRLAQPSAEWVNQVHPNTLIPCGVQNPQSFHDFNQPSGSSYNQFSEPNFQLQEYVYSGQSSPTSDEELHRNPVIYQPPDLNNPPRRGYQRVPAEQRDTNYHHMREKNNSASKKSRTKKLEAEKAKDALIEKLKKQVETLKSENNFLKGRLSAAESAYE